MRLALLCATLVTLVATALPAKAEGESILVEAVPHALARYEGRRDYRPKTAGRVLKAGAYVRCDGHCKLRLADGSHITLRDGGTIRTKLPRSLLLPGRGTVWTRTVGVEVLGGTVEVESLTRHLPVRIELFRGILTVEEGRAVLHAFRDRVGARVDAGEAWWRGTRRSAWEDVRAAGTHVLRADGGHLARPVLPPPAWAPGPDHRPVGLSTDGDRGAVHLAYQPHPHVDRVELALEGGTKSERRELAPSGRLTFELPVGVQRARLRWRDPEGFWTDFGAPATVAVARFELPRGGERIGPDHFELPPNTALRRRAGPPLELEFGRRGFRRVDEVSALEADGKLAVRLRGQPATLSHYRLEMRSLQADVQLTPVTPVWPDDPIEVRILLHDDEGAVDASKVRVACQAFLGGAPLDVSWSQAEGAIVGTIAGRPLAGPTTLRVMVRDPDDYAIGERILELIGSPPVAATKR